MTFSCGHETNLKKRFFSLFFKKIKNRNVCQHQEQVFRLKNLIHFLNIFCPFLFFSLFPIFLPFYIYDFFTVSLFCFCFTFPFLFILVFCFCLCNFHSKLVILLILEVQQSIKKFLHADWTSNGKLYSYFILLKLTIDRLIWLTNLNRFLLND